MTRVSRQFGLTVAGALTCLLMFSLAENSHATIIGAQSTGDQLAGGRIKVTFSQSVPKFATIVVGGPEHGTATSPGFFTFNVKGDTFLSDWTLKNDTTFDDILLVEFDLTGTMSQDLNGTIHSPGVLFDDNSMPSTPDSFAGREGAIYVSGPAILNSFELDPWGDGMNLGDEWVVEDIEYDGFGPQMTSVWRDDTDIVGVKTNMESPEPSTVVLLLIAAAFHVCPSRTLLGNEPTAGPLGAAVCTSAALSVSYVSCGGQIHRCRIPNAANSFG
jgi:hypothetical protein